MNKPSIALVLGLISTQAQAEIYRCTVEGRTIYQAQPCKDGHVVSTTQKGKTKPTVSPKPADMSSPAAIRSELDKAIQRRDALAREINVSQELEEKYRDEASLLRRLAEMPTLCAHARAEASGFDRLSIKYPNDPEFKARAAAAYRRASLDCR